MNKKHCLATNPNYEQHKISVTQTSISMLQKTDLFPMNSRLRAVVSISDCEWWRKPKREKWYMLYCVPFWTSNVTKRIQIYVSYEQQFKMKRDELILLEVRCKVEGLTEPMFISTTNQSLSQKKLMHFIDNEVWTMKKQWS